MPRRLKSPECVASASVLPANRFLTAELASSSFRITATFLCLSSPHWVSPFPLPASFYRAGRGIASAKIAAAACVRTYDFNAPVNWPIPTFPRDVQIAGDRGEKERRKRRVRTALGLWQAQYCLMPRSRERVVRNAQCKSQESLCNGSGDQFCDWQERRSNFVTESRNFSILKIPELKVRKISELFQTRKYKVVN